MKNRGMAVVGFVLALHSPPLSVAAVNPDARALAETVVETKKSLIDAEAERRKMLGSLYSITKRMKKISRDKSHLTDELFYVQDNVRDIAKVIAGLEAQIKEQRTLLRSRLRTLYKLSGEGYVGVLFSSSNSLEFDQTLKFLKIVADADYRLLRNYQKNVAVYKQQRLRLKTQVERLVGLERKIRSQEILLKTEHKAKTALVSGLEKTRKTALSRLRSLRTKTAKIEEMEDESLSGLLKTSFFEKKGQIPSPVAGTVLQDFGLIRDDKYMIQISHKGWSYSTPPAAVVTSVFEGTVAHFGWVPGYGQTLIIDHGDHYYTLYAHLARSRVRPGDVVSQGQTIAEAGALADGRGDGVYFEIRHFSEPENPKHWIAAKGVPVSSAEHADSVELATALQLGTQ